MTRTQINLQDSFLNQIRKENVPVTVYLVNGFQLKGHVRGFDNFTIIMENEGKQQCVYKHAISTITPSRAINHSFTEAAKYASETDEKKED